LERGQYNQIANYVYMQSEINIKVGNKAPKEYFEQIRSQFEGNNKIVSSLSSNQDLIANLSANCVPDEIMNMGIDNYSGFLEKRRVLMAQKIKEYYFSL